MSSKEKAEAIMAQAFHACVELANQPAEDSGQVAVGMTTAILEFMESGDVMEGIVRDAVIRFVGEPND